MPDYLHVCELAPASLKKSSSNAQLTDSDWVLEGAKENQLVTQRRISEFQTNMATLVLHTSIFQTLIFPYRNENKSFKTLKWEGKVLKKICVPWKWQLES